MHPGAGKLSRKRQLGNALGFVGQTASVMTDRHCCYSNRAPETICRQMVWLCANKTLRKQTEAGSGLWAMRVALCTRWAHHFYKIKTAPFYSFRTQNWICKLSTNVLKLPLPKGALLHCWREGKLVQPRWKTAWRFLKKLKKRVTM